jgi:hypothetical protein
LKIDESIGEEQVDQTDDVKQENDNSKHQHEDSSKVDAVGPVEGDPGAENQGDQGISSQQEIEPALSNQRNLKDLKTNLKDGNVEVKSKKKKKKKKKGKKRKNKKESQTEYDDEEYYYDDGDDYDDVDDSGSGGYDKHYEDDAKAAMGSEEYFDDEDYKDDNAQPTQGPSQSPFDEEKVKEIHEEASEEIKEMGKI